MVRSPAGTKNCWTSYRSRRQGQCGRLGAGNRLVVAGRRKARALRNSDRGKVGVSGQVTAAPPAGLDFRRGLRPEGRADTTPAEAPTVCEVRGGGSIPKPHRPPANAGCGGAGGWKRRCQASFSKGSSTAGDWGDHGSICLEADSPSFTECLSGLRRDQDCCLALSLCFNELGIRPGKRVPQRLVGMTVHHAGGKAQYQGARRGRERRFEQGVP